MSDKKYEKIKHVIDEIENVAEVKPTKKIKSIRVESNGYIRLYPNHNVNSIGKVAIGNEFIDVEIVEGSNVANGNKWYRVKWANGEGYIHASYVREI